MFEYLEDTNFLYELDKAKVRKYYIRLVLLDFKSEESIGEIQGIATNGSITVNSNSNVRRTINLTLQVDGATSNIEDIENLISIKSKIKVMVGRDNPLRSYEKYGDVIWFPQGVFLISSLQVARSSNGCSISLQGRDKTALLDGTMGGVLPASTTFSEEYIYDKDENVTVEYPTIRQIIQNAVEHFGGISADKIIISDLSDECKLLVRYMGETPLWFSNDYSTFVISEEQPSGFQNKRYSMGDDIGYRMTDFTYPGELTLNAGDTVSTLLGKILEVLGNYEWFFDLNGNFIFQEIKNYLNHSYTPIYSLGDKMYVRNFSDSKYAYALGDAETVISYQKSPKIAEIKNDFIVWGNRSTSSDYEKPIRFHLAIDVKPPLNLAKKCMWEISEIVDDQKIIKGYRYNNSSSNAPQESQDSSKTEYTLIGQPCNEWREELYRQALETAVSGTSEEEITANYRGDGTAIASNVYYGAELRAEWRKLYEPLDTSKYKKDWEALYPDTPWEYGWNPQILSSPSTLDYWLDFIDTEQAIAQYSVGEIGRRTIAVNDKDVKSIYNTEVPDIVFIENSNTIEEMRKQAPRVLQPQTYNNLNELRTAILNYYDSQSQDYCLLNINQSDYFKASSTPKSAYDEIRALMYQHITYNSTITINCQPKLYLQANNLIHVEDKKSNISGDYVLTQINIPLTYNATMMLVASEALTRV